MIPQNRLSVKRFFWMISGAEISVLEECTNDHNRFAISGALIAATCLIATSASGFAVYTYGDGNILLTVFLAALWGYLILCIDRFMVVSVKKNPTISEEQQPFWRPLTVRLLLAFTIAFFTTIPFYHVFFEKEILLEINAENAKELASHTSLLEKAFSKGELEISQNSYDQQTSDLEGKILATCPLPEYQEKMNEYRHCLNSEIPPLEKELQLWQTKAGAIYSKYINYPCDTNMRKPSDCYTSAEWEVVNHRNESKNNYSRAIGRRDALINEANTIRNKYNDGLREKIEEIDTLRKSNSATLRAANDSIQLRKATYDQSLESSKQDFVRQFVALWRAAFSSMPLLFLVLMLEAALLIIEILPTYNKLKTSIGDYDRAIYYREQSFELKLKNDVEIQREVEEIRRKSEASIALQSEGAREQSEVQLNKKLIEEISRVHTDVALRYLQEWEAQTTKIAPSKISTFIQSNYPPIGS